MKNAEGKQDMFLFSLKGRELFAFAGLYDEWRDPAAGNTLRSACIVTTEPNELVSTIHHRMPVILLDEHEEHWLAAEYDPSFFVELMRPHPYERMMAELCVTKKIITTHKSKAGSTNELTLGLFD